MFPLPGLLGFKLLSAGGAGIIGLILTGGLLFVFQDFKAGIAARERSRIEAAQQELNQIITEETRQHNIYLDNRYGKFQSDAAEVEAKFPLVIEEGGKTLPICPADCRLF